MGLLLCVLAQAPQFYIDQQAHIPTKDRRTFAGMVGALDDALNNITQTLSSNGAHICSLQDVPTSLTFTEHTPTRPGGHDTLLTCTVTVALVGQAACV
jgi:hypothetical protein